MAGEKGGLKKTRSTHLLKMDEALLTAKTDADKKQVVDDISTVALYLDSPEDCLVAAMLNHIGWKDSKPDREKFQQMYLKFLILIDNDPQKKADLFTKANAKVKALVGNDKETMMTALTPQLL